MATGCCVKFGTCSTSRSFFDASNACLVFYALNESEKERSFSLDLNELMHAVHGPFGQFSGPVHLLNCIIAITTSNNNNNNNNNNNLYTGSSLHKE